jgi:hypothetical protein
VDLSLPDPVREIGHGWAYRRRAAAQYPSRAKWCTLCARRIVLGDTPASRCERIVATKAAPLVVIPCRTSVSAIGVDHGLSPSASLATNEEPMSWPSSLNAQLRPLPTPRARE